ncbi:hypothetical protein IE985_07410 [Klebsiella pneumoniae]|nr:hypothetical protein [Klebsiella pneumoniae]
MIDPSDARKISTSEGQSYGLFFALAANDRAGFDKLLTWTQNNFGGRRSETTFAGLAVGQKDDEQWTLLDSNSASDSDLWIAPGAAGGGPPVATAAVHRDRKSPAGADCR